MTTQAPPLKGLRSIPATVVGLGVVSMVTDMSAEMVTAVLPLYLVYGVGVGLIQLGAIDALYIGATALLRLAGGWVSDRIGRPKAVAAVGYGLSAVSKLGFPLAGDSMPGVATVMGVDRAGKGIRVAPRDAMISRAASGEAQGRAFGLHRALDTAGALLGPLLAFGLIALVSDGFDLVFVASFCLGVVGLLILLFFVRVPASTVDRQKRRLNVAALKGTWGLTAVVAVFGLFTTGDMLLFVAMQRQAGLAPEVLPLLPLGTAVTFMLAAVPMGRAADRFGRWRVFLGGHVLLALAYLLIPVWPVALLLHGLFYAATDGVLMALVAPLIPAESRATGMGVVQTAQALARAAGAVLFGVLAAGVPQAFPIAAGALVLWILLVAWRKK